MIEALEALEGFIKVLPKQMMLLPRGSMEVKNSLGWLERAFERLTANQFDGFDPATTVLLPTGLQRDKATCYGASSGVTPECSGNEAELGEQGGTRRS